MTHAQALAVMGLPVGSNVWPACGCSDDPDDPDQGGTGDPETCYGPTHPVLVQAGLGPVETTDDEGVWVPDGPCLCPCHGGAS